MRFDDTSSARCCLQTLPRSKAQLEERETAAALERIRQSARLRRKRGRKRAEGSQRDQLDDLEERADPTFDVPAGAATTSRADLEAPKVPPAIRM